VTRTGKLCSAVASRRSQCRRIGALDLNGAVRNLHLDRQVELTERLAGQVDLALN